MVIRYSMRYLIKKIARKKVEQSAYAKHETVSDISVYPAKLARYREISSLPCAATISLNSESRFAAIRNAPLDQNKRMIDDGGRVVGSIKSQPIVRRRGLLIDSERTSTYGKSLVRRGGTL